MKLINRRLITRRKLVVSQLFDIFGLGDDIFQQNKKIIGALELKNKNENGKIQNGLKYRSKLIVRMEGYRGVFELAETGIFLKIPKSLYINMCVIQSLK